MRRLMIVCLCFCVFFSLCAPNIAAKTLDAATGLRGWDESGFVEEDATTKYYHRYVTLRPGEIYSDKLLISADRLESKDAVIGDSRIVEFLSNEDGEFTIKALKAGTTTIRLHYTRRIGFYGEIAHWGADKEEVLHIVVIPTDYPMEPTSAKVTELSYEDNEYWQDYRKLGITLKVGETYTGSLKVDGVSVELEGYYYDTMTDHSVVHIIDQDNDTFTVLAMKEGATTIVPGYQAISPGGRPDLTESLIITVKGHVGDATSEDTTLEDTTSQDYKYNLSDLADLKFENVVVTFDPNSDVKDYNDDAVGGMSITGDVKSPANVNSILICNFGEGISNKSVDWFNNIMNEMIPIWKSELPDWKPSSQGGVIVKPPYRENLRYPVWEDDAGARTDVFLLAFDENFEPVAYTVLKTQVPHNLNAGQSSSVEIITDNPSTDNSGGISVNIDGAFVNFDQPPVLENGRTLVPLRAIFEALGASVEWDDATQTVTAIKGGTQISLQIGSTQMYVNGYAKTLDVPAKLINSRTLVPVRAISEAFGCKVEWIQETQTVVITQ